MQLIIDKLEQGNPIGTVGEWAVNFVGVLLISAEEMIEWPTRQPRILAGSRLLRS